jgi:hypothetical protein
LCQKHNAPIRKFERVMVLPLFVLIHLPEDRRRVSVSAFRAMTKRDSVIVTALANASSVPGRTQTATAPSSAPANPRVPVPKSRVVSLSPTFAGRDLTFRRL